MKYLVLDTNILLLDAENLINLGNESTTIVLPETVLDEIDTKKSQMSELGYQARVFARLLGKAKTVEVIQKDGYIRTILKYKDNLIEVTSKESYDADKQVVEDSIRNDRKILEIAQYYDSIWSPVVFMSNDTMCRLRALPLGLNVTMLQLVDNVNFTFTKDFTVLPEDFGNLHNTKIFQIDPDYSFENFNYRFKCPNTEQVKLGTINNGVINILGKDTEKELRRQLINPMNSEQLFLSKAIQDTTTDIVICEAKAGSGKTAMALSNAMELVRLKKYNGIVYIRNTVNDLEAAEEVGYLSGNEEKFAPYMLPLEDTLDFMMRNKYKDSRLKGEEFEKFINEKIEEARLKHNIQALTGLGMRGRTFHNVIFWFDEAQNSSMASMQKLLTRVGKGCKVIITGSNRQIDNPYITKHNNGLSVLLNATRKQQGNIKIHAVELQKVVRSDTAEFVENLFSEAV